MGCRQSHLRMQGLLGQQEGQLPLEGLRKGGQALLRGFWASQSTGLTFGPWYSCKKDEQKGNCNAASSRQGTLLHCEPRRTSFPGSPRSFRFSHVLPREEQRQVEEAMMEASWLMKPSLLRGLTGALLLPSASPLLLGPCGRAASSQAEKQRSYWQFLRRKVLKPPLPPFSRVCQVGDPILRSLAATVEPSQIAGKEVQALIRTLVRVMRRERCVALSAPQVGLPLQVFVAEYPESLLQEHSPAVRQARQMAPFPLRVFVNPTMRVLDSQVVSHPEGCRSINGFSACVPRFLAVQVTGLNEAGEETTWQASGWAARVVQHEMDHLQGVLYIDKMESRTFVNVHWAELNE